MNDIKVKMSNLGVKSSKQPAEEKKSTPTPATAPAVKSTKPASSPVVKSTTPVAASRNATPPKNAVDAGKFANNSSNGAHGDDELNPFLRRKWTHIFTTFFDSNCSKQVDWGDFYLVVRRVRDVYGAESVQYTYARKTLEALWRGLCKLADSDDDELISLDEWIELMKKSMADMKKRRFDEVQFHWFSEYQNFMFKLFDVSEDGLVDLVEYVDGMSIYGYNYHDCVDAWRTFAGTSGDEEIDMAKITPAHWKAMFLELFFSEDENAIGNNLFGRIQDPTVGHADEETNHSSAKKK